MDQLGQNRVLVPLQPMPQRGEIRDIADDWTGVTSTAQRRKLQNRLNQRARRRRNMELKSAASRNCSIPALLAPIATHGKHPSLQVRQSLGSHGQHGYQDDRPPRLVCGLQGQDKQAMIRRFAQQAYSEYMAGAHCLGNLPMLMGVNIFYALSRNATALGVSEEWLLCDGESPYCLQGPGLGEHTLQTSRLPLFDGPQSLRPTKMQLSIAHHPWIDLFPVPRLRDNLLAAISNDDPIDEDELCYDMVEVTDGGVKDKAALIIWGEPWDPRGWEVSELFLKKWGALLEGCWEMLEATNYWREKRGEKRLVF
ncbi:hypothetical protein EDB81DRAFT_808981 [Dactylonectria macrodidyma]|uniref:BZIP domain-containing protein n=1 Tax=Dactylonectria macrodidyma TaxID=307937 RepID=A0A9P9E205_9HYPO|nr:hypothetical protein EDB81DRAFT_808981 [Dactylonectria macrodidyma]